MENKKQAIILSGVAIVALLALIIGATFAYFQATSNSSSNTNVNVTTYTTDLLTFEMGGDIKINADQTSFAEGKGNIQLQRIIICI
ncbi:MAG: SipW-dependent-type signal peptide-containing protein [Firmicutes bacterium]|nr:SipW-dependent-type signal peptide-containing protein [Bacillota bacterium]